MARDTNGRNGTIAKWLAILGIATLIAGWVWNAATMTSSLSANCQKDATDHPEFRQGISANREATLDLKKDVAYIRQAVDEIKAEVRRN